MAKLMRNRYAEIRIVDGDKKPIEILPYRGLIEFTTDLGTQLWIEIKDRGGIFDDHKLRIVLDTEIGRTPEYDLGPEGGVRIPIDVLHGDQRFTLTMFVVEPAEPGEEDDGNVTYVGTRRYEAIGDAGPASPKLVRRPGRVDTVHLFGRLKPREVKKLPKIQPARGQPSHGPVHQDESVRDEVGG